MHLRADRCSNCGATDDQALLGAFMRHIGGIGNVAVVACRDERRCWQRRDANENRPASDTDRAA